MIFRSLYNVLPVTRIKIILAGGLYRCTRLFFWNKHRQITRNGIHFQVDLSEGLDLSLFLFGNFQKHVSQNPLVKIPTDGIILDIGANVGMMALQFAQKVPQGKVYAFEPTDYAYQKFETNAHLNPSLAERIQLYKCFVSEQETDIAEIVAYSSWKVVGKQDPNQLHPIHQGSAQSTGSAGSIRLDDWVTRENIHRIDFIKIDTDGHEYEVLKGAVKTLEKFRPQLIFEIGQYVMTEKGIDFDFYHYYFSKLNYQLLDAANGEIVNQLNYHQHIPKQGTIDLLALPL